MRFNLLVLILFVSSLSKADPNRAPSMVEGEYQKTRDTLIQTFEANREEVWSLEQERDDVLANCLNAVQFYREGEAELSKYEKLLPIRYLDEAGKYEESLALSAADVTNLNALTEKYLRSRPIPEKVSVRMARRLVAAALSDLDDRISENRFPHPNGVSELEIIAYKLEVASAKMDQLKKHAKRLGLVLERDVAAVPTATETQPELPAVKAPYGLKP